MNLNDKQKEAVEHGKGPLLMSAGAGSGKTRALTSRLKHLIKKGVKPERILAITFTNKAADEMRQRVFGKDAQRPKGSQLPLSGIPFIGTFHSFGLRLLKQELDHLNRQPNLSIFDKSKSLSLVKRLLKSMDLDKESYKAPSLLSSISKIKSELQDLEFLSASEDARDLVLHRLFNNYEKELETNNAFDFDDLIEKPVKLLRRHPELLKKYQNLFDYILVDEYQDINSAQYQLVRLLSEKHQNINVVGDDQQAIYAFRGADFRNFLNFSRDWPKAKVVKLEQSYRSTKRIIQSANILIANNSNQNVKNLWTNNETGDKIQLLAVSNAEEEAFWLAGEVQILKKKDPEAKIAVLYRTNAQSRAIEQALLSFRMNYNIYGGLRFYDRKEIKDILSAITLGFNIKDSAAKERLEKTVGKRRSAKFFEELEQLSGSHVLAPLELINLFLSTTDYSTSLHTKTNNPQERLENIAELANFATSFENLGDFLDQVSLLEATDEESKSPKKAKERALRLMTIHIAKGLEFDYVFVIGLCDGLLPHQKSMSNPDELEEERRLMYVAMTRAKKRLYLSYYAYPSRFLYELPDEHCNVISSEGSTAWLPDEDDMYIEM